MRVSDRDETGPRHRQTSCVPGRALFPFGARGLSSCDRRCGERNSTRRARFSYPLIYARRPGGSIGDVAPELPIAQVVLCRSISRSIVASVIELIVALAISSISESTTPSARPTGVRSPGSRRSGVGAAEILEHADDVHQRQPPRVAGEPVAAADAAHRLDDAGARELGRAPSRDGATTRRTFARSRRRRCGASGPPRTRARCRARARCSSGASCAAVRVSISSGMNGPAIMPWLRKNDRISVLSRASIVRTLRTPARRNAAQIAASSRVPTPACRAVRLDVDREHPAAGRRAEFPVAHFADDEADDAPVRPPRPGTAGPAPAAAP